MTWLSFFGEHKEKYILALKFMSWLFNYMITLTISYFHIDYVKHKRIFILKSDYLKESSKLIKKMKDERRFFKEVMNENNQTKNQNKFPMLSFIPKSNGFRPIMK